MLVMPPSFEPFFDLKIGIVEPAFCYGAGDLVLRE